MIKEKAVKCMAYRNLIDWEHVLSQSVDARVCYLARSSQKATALAAATFRESTPWYMGIFTV